MSCLRIFLRAKYCRGKLLKFFSSWMDTAVTSMVFTFSHLGGAGRQAKKGQVRDAPSSRCPPPPSSLRTSTFVLLSFANLWRAIQSPGQTLKRASKLSGGYLLYFMQMGNYSPPSQPFPSSILFGHNSTSGTGRIWFMIFVASLTRKS